MARLAFTDPMAYIATQLAAHARGEPYDEDGMQEAATLVAAAQLVANGMSMDSVEALFRDRGHTFRIAYERDGDLTIDIVWDDEDAD